MCRVIAQEQTRHVYNSSRSCPLTVYQMYEHKVFGTCGWCPKATNAVPSIEILMTTPRPGAALCTWGYELAEAAESRAAANTCQEKNLGSGNGEDAM